MVAQASRLRCSTLAPVPKQPRHLACRWVLFFRHPARFFTEKPENFAVLDISSGLTGYILQEFC